VRIGIITPTYNRPDLLKRAIESILANDYSDWIMCIVDDCSNEKEKYENILSEYQNDHRIQYYRLEINSGVNVARNFALEKLLDQDCQYITLLDDDDMLTDRAFYRVLQEIKKYPEKKWYVSRCVDHDLCPITEIERYGAIAYLDYMASAGMRGDATHFIDRELIEKIRFATKVKQGQEWSFFIQIPIKMHVYDYNSKIIEYLDDGLTANSKGIDKEEEGKILEIKRSFGISRSMLRRRYFKYRMRKAWKEKQYLILLKYFLRIPLGI